MALWTEKNHFVAVFKQEAGFTLVEVLVASVLLVTGMVGAVSVIDASTRATSVSQRQNMAVSIAQRELEKIVDLEYKQTLLISLPASSSDPNSPLSRVNGSQFLTGTGAYEQLATGSGAEVASGPETFTQGGITAQIYRFITWVDAPMYQACSINCSSTQDYKRVTVAVKLSGGNNKGFDKYATVSTLVIDPSLGPQGQVTQPADPSPTQGHDNFYLYDEPQVSCSSNSYVVPSGSHATHDTLGYCGSAAADYPDLMGVIATPNPIDPDIPDLYNYSSDLSGTYDGGLALQRGSDCGTSGLTKYQMHSWASDPVSNSTYELTGKASFDFWTAMVGGVAGAGKVCVWLYDRVVSGNTPSDTLIGSSSYSLPSWPTTLTNLSFTFSHSSYSLAAGHTLRFVVTASSTSDADLQLVYDHPNRPTFIQVRTTTPVAG